MNNKNFSPHYPELKHPAQMLTSFLFTPYDGIFILGLKEGNTDRFKPDNTEHFLAWLDYHRIRDVFGKTIIINAAVNDNLNKIACK